VNRSGKRKETRRLQVTKEEEEKINGRSMKTPENAKEERRGKREFKLK